MVTSLRKVLRATLETKFGCILPYSAYERTSGCLPFHAYVTSGALKSIN